METLAAMRCLVACPSCRLQFDASGLAPKSRFRCSCGATIEVPKFHAGEAPVVRCSSCAAPRTQGALSCGHCGADYTLHEEQRNTLCPGCMTRTGDRARYCHSCGGPIVPGGEAGRPTRQACPACGRRHKLNSRSLGELAVGILECPRCAGLWVSSATFELLATRVRERAPHVGALQPAAPGAAVRREQGGSAYRSCPECAELMHCRNFAKRSGVIVDSCREHGIWFDAEELDRVLSFVREGKEAASAERDREEEREKARAERLKRDVDERMKVHTGMRHEREDSTRFDLRDVVELIGRLFSR